MNIKINNSLFRLTEAIIVVSLILGFSDRYFATQYATRKQLLTVIIAGIIFLKYSQGFIPKIIFYFTGFYFILLIYGSCLLLFANFQQEQNKTLTTLMIYPVFFYEGYNIAKDKYITQKIINLFYLIFAISIVVGVFERIVGPVYLENNLGLDLFAPIWQPIGLLKETKAEDVKYFRVFSIFVDHYSFSAYMVIIAFLSLLKYQLTKSIKYAVVVLVCLFSYSLTHNATALVSILLCIFLFSKRWTKIAIGIIISSFVIFLSAALSSDDFAVYFHTASMGIRWLYFKNILSLINIGPHNIIYFSDFSADSLWLWLAFRFGLFFPFLILSLFLLPLHFIHRKNSRKAYGVFMIMTILSLFSNGQLLFTSTVNIVFWFMVGLLANDMTVEEVSNNAIRK